MKVFTVGLEQKPPLEEGGGEKKSDSPPPGYSTTEARIPLPIGPELPRAPLAPHPIIVRKSRGYKGILLVMLSVFLMAVFALVLSEMAYNRQRDENFFKLRWAELKHRMGYDNTEAGPLEYYQRATASIGDKFDRMLNLAKSNEMAMPIAAQSQSLPVEEESTASSSTSVPPPPTPAEQPIVAIDTFPMKPPMPSLVDSSASRSSSQASFEVEPPPLFGGGAGSIGGALGQFRDARLQFLRNILQKIKQHAEDIGFDGTMQVSIIEVEPQEGEQGNSNEASSPMQNSNGPAAMHQLPPILRQLIQQQAQQQQQIPPQQQQFPPMPLHFFPHPRPLIDDFKNSRSFMDGFGEFHQPSPNFMQNNQLGEQQPEEREPPARMMPWAGQQQQPMDFPPPPPPQMMMQQQQQQQNGPDFVNNMPPPIWPRMSQFPRQPEMLFFHPIFPQQMSLRFPPPPPPSIPEWAAQQQSQQPQQNAQFPAMGPLARPSAFDRWQQQPQPQPQQQGMMMAGEMSAQQPAFQPQQPQQQQQQQQPSAQQIQIDFPEVKLPSPVVMGGDSAEDKFPVAPPNQQQPQSAPQQQQPQQKPDWLPKWLTENVPMMNNNGNNGATGGMDVMVGPPAQRPAEMVKFPSVTVLDSSSGSSNSASTEQPTAGKEEGGIVDNEESRQQTSDAGMEREDTVPAAGNVGGGKVIDSARGETGRVMVDDDGAAPQQQPEEVIEVDAAPQQSEQPAQSSQPDSVQPAQFSNQQPEQSSSSSPNNNNEQQQQPQQAPVQMQKWFPEVPSVFFQVDDPTDQQQQQPAQQQPQQQQPQVQPVGA